MEGIGSATNLDAALVLPVGMIHRDLSAAWVGRPTADGRIRGPPPWAHWSRDPRQQGARKPLHEIPDTPQPRLAEAWLAPSGASGEAIAVGLAGKVIVPLTRQLLCRITVHVAVLVS